MVGISNSPPAIPISDAMTPINAPASIAATVRTGTLNDKGAIRSAWFKANATAISTSKHARTRYNVPDRIRVAHVAPSHAPTRLPANRFSATVQRPATVPSGTLNRRAGSAVTTTIRLNALFTITACRAASPNTPSSSGSRNSAPPRPTFPPTTPITAPLISARVAERVGVAIVVAKTMILCGSRPALHDEDALLPEGWPVPRSEGVGCPGQAPIPRADTSTASLKPTANQSGRWTATVRVPDHCGFDAAGCPAARSFQRLDLHSLSM